MSEDGKLDMLFNALKKLPKIVLWLLTTLFVVYGVALLFDALYLHHMYSKTFEMLGSNIGIPIFVAKAISIIVAALFYCIVPLMIFNFLFSRRIKAAAYMVLLACVWFLGVEFLAIPKQGNLFNPITGKALYKYYKNPEGAIELFPLEYKCHPNLGCSVPLLEVTPQIAKEYQKQHFSVSENGNFNDPAETNKTFNKPDDAQAEVSSFKDKNNNTNKAGSGFQGQVNAPRTTVPFVYLQDYLVEKSADGYKLTLDARRAMAQQTIEVNGSSLEVFAKGLVCAKGTDGKNHVRGPAGMTDVMGGLTNDAHYMSFIVQVDGGKIYEVNTYAVIPLGQPGKHRVSFGTNIPEDKLTDSVGGFTVDAVVRL